jgi:hypothetical protein
VNDGRAVFAQLMSFLVDCQFRRYVARCSGDSRSDQRCRRVRQRSGGACGLFPEQTRLCADGSADKSRGRLNRARAILRRNNQRASGSSRATTSPWPSGPKSRCAWQRHQGRPQRTKRNALRPLALAEILSTLIGCSLALVNLRRLARIYHQASRGDRNTASASRPRNTI